MEVNYRSLPCGGFLYFVCPRYAFKYATFIFGMPLIQHIQSRPTVLERCSNQNWKANGWVEALSSPCLHLNFGGMGSRLETKPCRIIVKFEVAYALLRCFHGETLDLSMVNVSPIEMPVYPLAPKPLLYMKVAKSMAINATPHHS